MEPYVEITIEELEPARPEVVEDVLPVEGGRLLLLLRLVILDH